MVFCFVQNFFFGQHKSQNIYFFCRAKREFFFQNLTLGYMTKTLNQIIFFSSTKIRIFFSAKLRIRLFFQKKTITPPFRLNGRSLSCVGKIMESVIYKYVFNHLQRNKLIYEYQSGFLSKYSTVHQLLEMYNFILNSLEKRNLAVCFL